ncbi:hypothetical protein M433DRAFT_112459 [Acidomyces richmondensis BFW]|nr:hypothetical protein M433DRAFT_112459 [Acidomyces richmondensis BFW]
MRTALNAAAQRRAVRAHRNSNPITAVPPAEESADYLPELAAIAASILYRSPLPSPDGRPMYVLNAAAFPDALDVDYDSLLAYVLARLPGEDELLAGTDYEIVFFAGGPPDGATSDKKSGPGMGWYLQAYHVLSRALRKKLQRLYIVHPRTWVRVLLGVFATVVSPKFRRKIVHVNTLSQLALHLPIERLLIPPSAYLHDRRLVPEIDVPYASGRRAFGARHPLPKDLATGKSRLPRVLRETTSFLLLPSNVTTEGVFRIPPHSTLAGVLREAYDRGQRFIVWKERGATFVEPGMDAALVDEIRLEDAYHVHLATALIKTWYRELREPIFPESAYPHLRNTFPISASTVRLEDLLDLLSPISRTSPLSLVSREILRRHLLPMLSTVATHETENKMNADNLAICFAMCLVCGNDQLEDAKVASIVRRILAAAIEMWPQLCHDLNISGRAFSDDLKPPIDMRNYEDPLDEPPYHTRSSEDDAIETKDGMQLDLIQMDDAEHELADDASQQPKVPTLPPRPRQRAASAAKHLAGLATAALPKKVRSRANSGAKESSPVDSMASPSLSVRPTDSELSPQTPPIDETAMPVLPQKTSAPSGLRAQLPALDTATATASPSVKRKPAPALPPDVDQTDNAPVSSLGNPPRSSHVFDSDGKSIHMANSPESYVFVNGFGSQTSPADGQRNLTEAGLTPELKPMQVAFGMPKRKASPDIISPPLATDVGENKSVCRKPSWPASSTTMHSLARPVFTGSSTLRHAQTIPIINTPPADNNGGADIPSSTNLPKPRTPSPGLLKRMTSMEQQQQNYLSYNGNEIGRVLRPQLNPGSSVQKQGLAEPKKLNLRKASVDDLRRLYEERANTAESLKTLASIGSGGRRESAQSVHGV